MVRRVGLTGNRQERSGVRGRGSAQGPNWQPGAIRWCLARDDIASVRKICGTGDGGERCVQSDLTRRARRTVKGRFEMAIQVVVGEGSDQKDREIDRQLDGHRPERAISPHLANHRNSMIRRFVRGQQHSAPEAACITVKRDGTIRLAESRGSRCIAVCTPDGQNGRSR